MGTTQQQTKAIPPFPSTTLLFILILTLTTLFTFTTAQGGYDYLNATSYDMTEQCIEDNCSIFEQFPVNIPFNHSYTIRLNHVYASDILSVNINSLDPTNQAPLSVILLDGDGYKDFMARDTTNNITSHQLLHKDAIIGSYFPKHYYPWQRKDDLQLDISDFFIMNHDEVNIVLLNENDYFSSQYCPYSIGIKFHGFGCLYELGFFSILFTLIVSLYITTRCCRLCLDKYVFHWCWCCWWDDYNTKYQESAHKSWRMRRQEYWLFSLSYHQAEQRLFYERTHQHPVYRKPIDSNGSMLNSMASLSQRGFATLSKSALGRGGNMGIFSPGSGGDFPRTSSQLQRDSITMQDDPFKESTYTKGNYHQLGYDFPQQYFDQSRAHTNTAYYNQNNDFSKRGQYGETVLIPDSGRTDNTLFGLNVIDEPQNTLTLNNQKLSNSSPETPNQSQNQPQNDAIFASSPAAQAALSQSDPLASLPASRAPQSPQPTQSRPQYQIQPKPRVLLPPTLAPPPSSTGYDDPLPPPPALPVSEYHGASYMATLANVKRPIYNIRNINNMSLDENDDLYDGQSLRRPGNSNTGPTFGQTTHNLQTKPTRGLPPARIDSAFQMKSPVEPFIEQVIQEGVEIEDIEEDLSMFTPFHIRTALDRSIPINPDPAEHQSLPYIHQHATTMIPVSFIDPIYYTNTSVSTYAPMFLSSLEDFDLGSYHQLQFVLSLLYADGPLSLEEQYFYPHHTVSEQYYESGIGENGEIVVGYGDGIDGTDSGSIDERKLARQHMAGHQDEFKHMTAGDYENSTVYDIETGQITTTGGVKPQQDFLLQQEAKLYSDGIFGRNNRQNGIGGDTLDDLSAGDRSQQLRHRGSLRPSTDRKMSIKPDPMITMLNSQPPPRESSINHTGGNSILRNRQTHIDKQISLAAAGGGSRMVSPLITNQSFFYNFASKNDKNSLKRDNTLAKFEAKIQADFNHLLNNRTSNDYYEETTNIDPEQQRKQLLLLAQKLNPQTWHLDQGAAFAVKSAQFSGKVVEKAGKNLLHVVNPLNWSNMIQNGSLNLPEHYHFSTFGVDPTALPESTGDGPDGIELGAIPDNNERVSGADTTTTAGATTTAPGSRRNSTKTNGLNSDKSIQRGRRVSGALEQQRRARRSKNSPQLSHHSLQTEQSNSSQNSQNSDGQMNEESQHQSQEEEEEEQQQQQQIVGRERLWTLPEEGDEDDEQYLQELEQNRQIQLRNQQNNPTFATPTNLDTNSNYSYNNSSLEATSLIDSLGVGDPFLMPMTNGDQNYSYDRNDGNENDQFSTPMIRDLSSPTEIDTNNQHKLFIHPRLLAHAEQQNSRRNRDHENEEQIDDSQTTPTRGRYTHSRQPSLSSRSQSGDNRQSGNNTSNMSQSSHLSNDKNVGTTPRSLLPPPNITKLTSYPSSRSSSRASRSNLNRTESYDNKIVTAEAMNLDDAIPLNATIQDLKPMLARRFSVGGSIAGGRSISTNSRSRKNRDNLDQNDQNDNFDQLSSLIDPELSQHSSLSSTSARKSNQTIDTITPVVNRQRTHYTTTSPRHNNNPGQDYVHIDINREKQLQQQQGQQTQMQQIRDLQDKQQLEAQQTGQNGHRSLSGKNTGNDAMRLYKQQVKTHTMQQQYLYNDLTKNYAEYKSRKSLLNNEKFHSSQNSQNNSDQNSQNTSPSEYMTSYAPTINTTTTYGSATWASVTNTSQPLNPLTQQQHQRHGSQTPTNAHNNNHLSEFKPTPTISSQGGKNTNANSNTNTTKGTKGAKTPSLTPSQPPHKNHRILASNTTQLDDNMMYGDDLDPFNLTPSLHHTNHANGIGNSDNLRFSPHRPYSRDDTASTSSQQPSIQQDEMYMDPFALSVAGGNGGGNRSLNSFSKRDEYSKDNDNFGDNGLNGDENNDNYSQTGTYMTQDDSISTYNRTPASSPQQQQQQQKQQQQQQPRSSTESHRDSIGQEDELNFNNGSPMPDIGGGILIPSPIDTLPLSQSNGIDYEDEDEDDYDEDEMAQRLEQEEEEAVEIKQLLEYGFVVGNTALKNRINDNIKTYIGRSITYNVNPPPPKPLVQESWLYQVDGDQTTAGTNQKHNKNTNQIEKPKQTNLSSSSASSCSLLPLSSSPLQFDTREYLYIGDLTHLMDNIEQRLPNLKGTSYYYNDISRAPEEQVNLRYSYNYDSIPSKLDYLFHITPPKLKGYGKLYEEVPWCLLCCNYKPYQRTRPPRVTMSHPFSWWKYDEIQTKLMTRQFNQRFADHQQANNLTKNENESVGTGGKKDGKGNQIGKKDGKDMQNLLKPTNTTRQNRTSSSHSTISATSSNGNTRDSRSTSLEDDVDRLYANYAHEQNYQDGFEIFDESLDVDIITDQNDITITKEELYHHAIHHHFRHQRGCCFFGSRYKPPQQSGSAPSESYNQEYLTSKQQQSEQQNLDYNINNLGQIPEGRYPTDYSQYDQQYYNTSSVNGLNPPGPAITDQANHQPSQQQTILAQFNHPSQLKHEGYEGEDEENNDTSTFLSGTATRKRFGLNELFNKMNIPINIPIMDQSHNDNRHTKLQSSDSDEKLEQTAQLDGDQQFFLFTLHETLYQRIVSLCAPYSTYMDSYSGGDLFDLQKIQEFDHGKQQHLGVDMGNDFYGKPCCYWPTGSSFLASFSSSSTLRYEELYASWRDEMVRKINFGTTNIVKHFVSPHLTPQEPTVHTNINPPSTLSHHQLSQDQGQTSVPLSNTEAIFHNQTTPSSPTHQSLLPQLPPPATSITSSTSTNTNNNVTVDQFHIALNSKIDVIVHETTDPITNTPALYLTRAINVRQNARGLYIMIPPPHVMDIYHMPSMEGDQHKYQWGWYYNSANNYYSIRDDETLPLYLRLHDLQQYQRLQEDQRKGGVGKRIISTQHSSEEQNTNQNIQNMNLDPVSTNSNNNNIHSSGEHNIHDDLNDLGQGNNAHPNHDDQNDENTKSDKETTSKTHIPTDAELDALLLERRSRPPPHKQQFGANDEKMTFTDGDILKFDPKLYHINIITDYNSYFEDFVCTNYLPEALATIPSDHPSAPRSTIDMLFTAPSDHHHSAAGSEHFLPYEQQQQQYQRQRAPSVRFHTKENRSILYPIVSVTPNFDPHFYIYKAMYQKRLLRLLNRYTFTFPHLRRSLTPQSHPIVVLKHLSAPVHTICLSKNEKIIPSNPNTHQSTLPLLSIDNSNAINQNNDPTNLTPAGHQQQQQQFDSDDSKNNTAVLPSVLTYDTSKYLYPPSPNKPHWLTSIFYNLALSFNWSRVPQTSHKIDCCETYTARPRVDWSHFWRSRIIYWYPFNPGYDEDLMAFRHRLVLVLIIVLFNLCLFISFSGSLERMISNLLSIVSSTPGVSSQLDWVTFWLTANFAQSFVVVMSSPFFAWMVYDCERFKRSYDIRWRIAGWTMYLLFLVVGLVLFSGAIIAFSLVLYTHRCDIILEAMFSFFFSSHLFSISCTWGIPLPILYMLLQLYGFVPRQITLPQSKINPCMEPQQIQSPDSKHQFEPCVNTHDVELGIDLHYIKRFYVQAGVAMADHDGELIYREARN